MRYSPDRFITTHVGSLPHLFPLDPEQADYEARLRDAVKEVTNKQREIGLDIINEGEYAKEGNWLSYVENRLGGFTVRESDGRPSVTMRGRDREEFAAFYAHAAEVGALFYAPTSQAGRARPRFVCTEPITYRGQAAIARQIELAKDFVTPEEGFLTTTAPASLEPYRENEFYKSEHDFIFAIAEAMRVEYEAITDAGFTLQVDDAWLPALWDRIGIQMGMHAFKSYCRMRIEALNHALRDVRSEQIRYHLCWGSWHGPHAFDIEMKDMIDLMLSVKASYYSFEAANARHEHEFQVWDGMKLPDGKVILPGVITHSTDLIEHEELVSMRIQNFAKRVGRENVIASADCGFGGRSHPQIAWAKLKSLVKGARLASKAMY
jgi:5-methyltetrahydropteroyltriglutamate--homocysteine methyltransferase